MIAWCLLARPAVASRPLYREGSRYFALLPMSSDKVQDDAPRSNRIADTLGCKTLAALLPEDLHCLLLGGSIGTTQRSLHSEYRMEMRSGDAQEELTSDLAGHLPPHAAGGAEQAVDETRRLKDKMDKVRSMLGQCALASESISKEVRS